MPTYDQATSAVTSQDDLVCFATGDNLTAVAIFKIFDTINNQVAASPTFGGASMVKQTGAEYNWNTNRWFNLEIWTLDGISSGSNTFSYDFSDPAIDSEVTLITISGANNGAGSGVTTVGNDNNPVIIITPQQSESLIVGGGMVGGGDSDPFSASSITFRTNDATGTNTNLDFGYFDGERSVADITPHSFGATAAVSD